MIETPNKKPYRVAVCVPSGDQVKAGFAYDLARMTSYMALASGHEVDLFVFMAQGSILPQLRANLVQRALAADATHVLFLDSDMRFPKETLQRLLAHNEAVVGVNYAKRAQPIMPTARSFFGEQGETHPVYEGTGLEQVAVLGFGATLIHTDVFRMLPQPWFNFYYGEGGYIGEDATFCLMVAKQGLAVMVDHDLSRQIGHIGEMVFTLDHAQAQREFLSSEG